ncbi:DUF4426 domain-containing protein [Stenotrophomonas sp. YIM B06876]|uniref:DUF4426 domain-containing protein n=1 Tax=Stenotrophomonas sp. YIM B06876 TaxID=3060211 RepID=UPI002738E2BE|nr:DUF4426 domain-containing protein [Stenotrophomonas sp. YIM B06876]
MRLAPWLLLCTLPLLWLPGCSAGDAPQPAQLLAPTPTHADFGHLRVRYNALPTLAMNAAVARRYGVNRDAGQALLVVALREVQQGEELPLGGEISATATDLSGRRQTITLRPVTTGAYVDQVGTVRTGVHDSVRFQLKLQTSAGNGIVEFERNF